MREQCPYSDRAPGNDAASARVLRLPGECVGVGWPACPDRPPSKAVHTTALAHRLFESAHPVTFSVVPVVCKTTRARVGTRNTDDDWREDSSPRVRRLRLRLLVAPLLLQALPTRSEERRVGKEGRS